MCVMTGGGKTTHSLLHPISVNHTFLTIGVDVMDLPTMENAYCHVLVYQDYLTKWPEVIPMLDQWSVHVVRALVEIVPVWCARSLTLGLWDEPPVPPHEGSL